MPFLAEETFPIPTKDILSWYFDDPRYNLDDKIYIDASDESRFWTGRQARQAVRQLAAGFTAKGLKAGDCVCIHSFNSIDYPVLANGIVSFGGVFTGTNPVYKPVELSHHLRTSKSKLVIVEPDLLTHLLIAAKDVGIPFSNILLFDPQERCVEGAIFQTWSTLFQHGERDWIRFNDHKIASETTACLLYSSGTTGLPKAGMISHYNLIAQQTLVMDWKPNKWHPRRLVALPMFHAATVPIALFTPLRSGDTCWVMKRYDLQNYMANIEKFDITEGAFVPPIVVAIITSPDAQKYSLKSMRYANAGAAPLGKESQARLKALLPHDTALTQVWGMTETTCVCSMIPASEGHETTGSVGRMLPNVDAKLVDDAGNDVTGYDIRGELCVRGPNVIRGYFENTEANARDWDADGFFHTGDIGYRSVETKYWYIVDRKKELIKVRSYQLAPAELEAVLVSHPGIIDAAVIGVKSMVQLETELPRAYVVRRNASSQSPDEREVYEFVSDRLASYKRLDGGIKFLDSIPKTASGKILKRTLRDEAGKEQTKRISKL